VPPTLSLLTRNPDFRKLFAAELVMFGGDWFVMIPMLALLPDLTGSGFWGGLILAVDTACMALLLPYTGTVADRVDRRKIMMLANLVSVAAMLSLLLVRSSGTAWVALVGVAVVAVAKAFYSPAASAALPNVVDPEDLPAANALGGSAWGTMLVVGGSLGGLVSAWLGPYACFGIAAGCLAFGAWLLARVRRPLQEQREVSDAPVRSFAAIAEALRYIGHRPRVAALVTVKSAVGLGNGVLGVFPVLVATSFAVRNVDVGLGLLFAARGAGALLGPLFMRRVLAHSSWLLPGLAISMAVYGVAYIGVALSPWFALALALVMVAHFAGGGNWVMSNYALQTAVPDALRGRVFATDMMIAMLAVSLSVLLAGFLVDHANPRVLIGAFAGVTLGYSVVWRLITWRLLRRAGLTEDSRTVVS
jgi:MFS family permease